MRGRGGQSTGARAEVVEVLFMKEGFTAPREKRGRRHSGGSTVLGACRPGSPPEVISLLRTSASPSMK